MQYNWYYPNYPYYQGNYINNFQKPTIDVAPINVNFNFAINPPGSLWIIFFLQLIFSKDDIKFLLYFSIPPIKFKLPTKNKIFITN